MFIELTDLLRCPADHAEGHLVVATGEMSGRTVSRGMLGCPICHAEFRVEQGVVRFGTPDQPTGSGTVPDAPALQAFLGLSNPGGYVALVGSAARAGEALSVLLGGVRLIGVNAPAGVSRSPLLSLVEASGMIPLRTASVRGVVVGGERAAEPWLSQAARVVLPGLRIVVLSNEGEVTGIERIATGPGVWVGEKKEKGKGKRET